MKKNTPAKSKVVLEILKEEKTLAQIAAEFGVHPNQLSKWKKDALELLKSGLVVIGKKSASIQIRRCNFICHSRTNDKLLPALIFDPATRAGTGNITSAASGAA